MSALCRFSDAETARPSTGAGGLFGCDRIIVGDGLLHNFGDRWRSDGSGRHGLASADNLNAA